MTVGDKDNEKDLEPSTSAADSEDYGEDEPTEQTEEGDDAQEEASSPQVRPLENHPELVNLAEGMDEERLQQIGDLVFQEYTEDLESRKEWEETQAKYIKLAAQIDRPVNPPWQGSSAESLPILAEAANQFHARAVKAFFPTPEIIKALPIGKVTEDSMDRADRVGKHMSWQCMVKDRSYYRNKDRLFASLPIHGSFFTKTYRDPIKKCNVVENVRALDLIVPYGTGPRDIEDVPRKTHIIWMEVTKSNFYAKNKFFICPAEPMEEANTDSAPQQAIDEVAGVTQGQTGEAAPQAKIIEQHRLLDLDDDDLEEPYIVWVDAASQKVLRIQIRWEVYADDVPLTDQMGQPVSGQDGMPVIQHKKGDPSNYKEPIEYFTHYTYLENPDGFYGLGMGYLVGNANTAINKLLRQIVDAGTLANTHTGFVNKRLGIKKGPLEVEIGKLNPIDAPVEDIKRNIYMLEYKGPNEGLVSTMKLLKAAADRLAGSTEVLTGSPDKVLQPTTVAALIEQGLMAYTSVQNRIHNAWEEELNKLYRLNRIYMDESEYYALNNLTGVQGGQVYKQDYADDLRVRPAVDPNQATEQQRISKAEAEYKILSTSPLVQHDPQLQWQMNVRYLKAIGSPDIDQVMPKPPPPGPPPPPKEVVLKKLELDSMERMKLAELEVKIEIERINAQAQIEVANARAMYGAQTGPGFPSQLGEYDIPPGQLENGNGQPGQPGAAPQPGNGGNGSGPMAPPSGNPMVPRPPQG